MSDRRDPRDMASLYVYELEEGWTIYAGKTDADNERLSIKLAHPKDWWFHVRGMPGSHVLLRGPDGEEASREQIEAAASVAAYHSKARAGGTVPVSACRAQFVSKPRGAPRGTVNIRKERVIKVRPGLPVR